MIGANPHSLTIPRRTAFDAVILADHAAGLSREAMARKYDTTPAGLEVHLRRVGLLAPIPSTASAEFVEQVVIEAPKAEAPVTPVPVPSRPPPAPEPKRQFPSDEELLADRAEGMTHAVIARKYGCSLTTLGAALKRLGVAKGRWPEGRYVPPPELVRPKGPPRRSRKAKQAAEVAPKPEPPAAEPDLPRTAAEADLDSMILAAKVCMGAKCTPATAIGIVTTWRAMK